MSKKKPDFTDGLHVLEMWSLYTQATRPHWKRFPELLAAGYSIILSEPTEQSIMRTFYNIAIKAVAFLLQVKKSTVSLPICDALLFHSSDKPSVQPATDELADRLTRRGLRVAMLFTSQKMTIWECDEPSPARINLKDVSDYPHWMGHASSRRQACRLLCRSFMVSSLLFARLLCKGKSSRKLLTTNPFNVWYQLLLSALRLEVCDRILNQLQPRFLLVNNERVSVASELVQSRGTEKTHKVLFLNELPLFGVIPINSHEVWVWNQTVIDSLMKINKDYPMPEFSIIGSSEVDFALDKAESHNEHEMVLRRLTEGKRVFLFLVDHTPSKLRNTTQIAAEAHRWLGYAAGECPDWHFILKTRPYHHGVVLPGIEYLDHLKNVSISTGEIDYREFLGWDNIVAVGGCTSTGLYVAAGAGKVMCRFLISSRQFAIPVLDEVTVPIHSPEDLVKLLHNLEQEGKIKDYISSTFGEKNQMFPYQGQTVDRMESLCLKYLVVDVKG